jgi:uracil-DNA glycosylase
MIKQIVPDFQQILPADWLSALQDELSKGYVESIFNFLEAERVDGATVYPPVNQIFRALQETPLSSVKVVILGQDPYYRPGQAEGLAFSVAQEVVFPRSLTNIFKELESDLGIQKPKSGSLIPWAKQGVLLLNTTLTVREGCPLSHEGIGWERFTNAIVTQVAKENRPVVYILWGKHALDKCQSVFFRCGMSDQMTLYSAHPSPLSARKGFFGSRPFSRANELLIAAGVDPIDWRL